MKKITMLAALVLLATATAAMAAPAATPLYTVEIQSSPTKAINYVALGGSAKITFRGTVLAQGASGEAKVSSAAGVMSIEAKFKGLEPATKYGAEYLTYVLWAISPEGRPSNLGEIILKNGKSDLKVTTRFQTFALVVTAEPYYAVSQVGNVVVLENVIDEKNQKYLVDVNYEHLPRGQYSLNMDPADLKPMTFDKKVPMEVYQGRNAVKMAKAAGADKYAAEPFRKATDLQAEIDKMLAGKKFDSKKVAAMSRQTIQTADDSRRLAIRKQAEVKAAEEKAAMEAQVAAAQKAAAAEAAQRALAQKDAEMARGQASEANAAAAAAGLRADQAEKDKAQMRGQLKDQLNAIMQTTDSARGLIVSMSGLLFETGKSTLLPPVREKLARVSGILLGHPGLKLEVEGHTDNVGSDASNQTLSEKRAAAVKDYLISQGVSADSVVSRGFGETKPVATNDTPDGRSQNRRVEIVVSGEAIGQSAPAK